MKRPYGTGHVYEKWGAYYGRWRTPDGRRRNRRLGPKRAPGSGQGLTRAMAERALRQAQQGELAEVPPADDARDRTVTRCIDSQFWRYDVGASSSSSRSRGAIAASSRLTIVCEPVEEGWLTASIPAVPGTTSAGSSQSKARDNVIDALREMLGSTPQVDEGACRVEHVGLRLELECAHELGHER